MIRARVPGRAYRAPAGKRRLHLANLITVRDPEGDLTGLCIGRWEFAYGWVMDVWTDGTQFLCRKHVYTKRGRALIDERGEMVSPVRFDAGQIVAKHIKREAKL